MSSVFDSLPFFFFLLAENPVDGILQHFETMGNHCLLVFTAESPFWDFLGGAGFCPSTVAPQTKRRVFGIAPTPCLRAHVLVAMVILDLDTEVADVLLKSIQV